MLKSKVANQDLQYKVIYVYSSTASQVTVT